MTKDCHKDNIKKQVILAGFFAHFYNPRIANPAFHLFSHHSVIGLVNSLINKKNTVSLMQDVRLGYLMPTNTIE